MASQGSASSFDIFHTFNWERLYERTGSVGLPCNNAHPFILLGICEPCKGLWESQVSKSFPLLRFRDPNNEWIEFIQRISFGISFWTLVEAPCKSLISLIGRGKCGPH
jgi:hypothetical protein